jgi:hypothetical protein
MINFGKLTFTLDITRDRLAFKPENQPGPASYQRIGGMTTTAAQRERESIVESRE